MMISALPCDDVQTEYVWRVFQKKKEKKKDSTAPAVAAFWIRAAELQTLIVDDELAI